MSTSQTVIEDNASLNVRWDELPQTVKASYPASALRQPTRVILDRQAQLLEGEAAALKLYQSDAQVLRVAESEADIVVPLNGEGQLDIKQLIQDLPSHHIDHLWVEAGATLAKSFIENQLVDELILYLAPKLMGSDGRGLMGALGLSSMADVIDVTIKDVRMVGPDIRVVAHPVWKS